MPEGIRATVSFANPDICPIVEASRQAETTIDSVTTNSCPSGCGASVVEFSVDAGALDADLEPIVSYDDTSRYRLVLDEHASCPCETLAEHGCPAARYVAENGTLTLVFHAADWEELKAVVAALDERFPAMDVKRFVRSPTTDSSQDHVLVDRSKLTDRQIEVLETAYEMGYFERSRRTNATAVAAALDIDPSTFREHLAAAESKLLEDVL